MIFHPFRAAGCVVLLSVPGAGTPVCDLYAPSGLSQIRKTYQINRQKGQKMFNFIFSREICHKIGTE